MRSITELGVMYEEYLSNNQTNHIPKVLEESASHIMSMKGKRIRPLLLLESCQLFGGNVEKALPIATVIEIFHNFSLVHADIIDEAEIRRGEAAVHAKYGTNQAILTGDAMLLSTFMILSEHATEHLQDLIDTFSDAAMKVVEGEQEDLNFETREEVSMDEYMEMIAFKTSVLLGASLKMGAILAGASEEDQEHIYDFGLNLGLAFQIKDDYLDAYADPEKFGKKVGGDIIQNKKTYLMIKAFQVANEVEHDSLTHLLSESNATKKVDGVLELYDELGIKEYTFDKMEELYEKAKNSLQHTSLSSDQKEHLAVLADSIYHRDF